ncbi:ABC transporter substrate-binding protein [Gleimia hominis]|uniref:ABC transporter substrate-binding protein n=1 Tax=Gleimia hominis TaxID=595468 RepID=UPI000C801EA5|nr:ABC transporter substrate-binding protein [Gleimia hominis]WIK64974.1 ABC transporter substrate-binding protein [Gleimia hominis]
MKKLPALVCAITLAGSLALAGCSDPDDNADKTTNGAPSASESTDTKTFDFSKLKPQDNITAMVPQAVKDQGILRNGASTDYAPAEFRDTDGKTPMGYDIDIVKALALVMGLKDGQTSHAEFPAIIPALGSKFDVGASAFTITPDRIKEANMIAYVEVGSAYSVKKGNPGHFDPKDPCGKTIGVQTGTYQHDYARELSDKCVSDGKEAIKVMPHKLNTDVVTKVAGGQYDAGFCDSTVTGYAIEQTKDQLEQVGDVLESEPQGIVVSKNDEELTKAVQAAMQYLMDEGYLKEILGTYGAQSAALSEAQLNPGK